MTAVQVLSKALDDELRRELIYGGDLLVFKNVEPMIKLCALTDNLIRKTLGTSDPVRSQFELEPNDYLARVGSLQSLYRGHEQARRLLLAVLEHVGVDLEQTYWDWLYLRVMPHGDGHADRRITKLGFHRDTWSSSVYSQTNWWAPIYPITWGRTIAFYPEYWSRPLANTSAEWDLEEIRAQKSGGTKAAIPLVPEPLEPPDTTSELRLVIEPGDLLCFSGAHLHASVLNTTGVARFSVEVRTVDARDELRGRGAPNVDGKTPRVALDWFQHVSYKTSLRAIV